MHLDFTPDQDDLRQSVRSVLAKECPPAFVREHVERVVQGQPSDAGARLWATLAALDWPALTIGEEAGGVGLGPVELAVVVEELGRAIAPGPFLTTVAAFVAAVRECAGPGGLDRLRAVASGALTGTLADPVLTDVSAYQTAGGWRLEGMARHVLCAMEVDEVGLVAHTPGGLVLAVVGLDAVERVPVRVSDPTRTLAHLRLDRVTVSPGDVVETGPAEVGRAVEQITVALALEMVGTCAVIFETNLDYAKQRVQFGVPIGSFQAVKHKLADVYVAIERARATCLFAAATLAEDDPRRGVAASMAKAAAGECQRLVAQAGIQLLGGIGYTWEHDQHLWVKRAKAGDAQWGTAAEHRARVADALGL